MAANGGWLNIGLSSSYETPPARMQIWSDNSYISVNCVDAAPPTTTASPNDGWGPGSGSGSSDDGWRAVIGYHCSSGYTQYGFGARFTLAQCQSACLGMSSCGALFYNDGSGQCYTVAGSCTDTTRSSGWTIYFQPTSTTTTVNRTLGF